MFVAMILASTAFGWWVDQSRKWIRERHEVLDTHIVIDDTPVGKRPLAPGGLWLFGEEGIFALKMIPGEPGIESGPRKDRVQRLFPEAIFGVHVPPRPTLNLDLSPRRKRA